MESSQGASIPSESPVVGQFAKEDRRRGIPVFRRAETTFVRNSKFFPVSDTRIHSTLGLGALKAPTVGYSPTVTVDPCIASKNRYSPAPADPFTIATL